MISLIGGPDPNSEFNVHIKFIFTFSQCRLLNLFYTGTATSNSLKTATNNYYIFSEVSTIFFKKRKKRRRYGLLNKTMAPYKGK